ncbi:DUF1146 family protein [Enterococcus hirae]|nr:DUF1146 family protein [Enterococcus hirae]
MYFSVENIVRMICYIGFTYLSYWSLNSLQFEKLFRRGHDRQLRLFLTFLAMIMGFLVTNFLLDFVASFQDLFQKNLQK